MIVDEERLQDVSRALTHLVFRNTIVEDLHAEGAKLDDKTMKIINKEVNNRIYTLIKWYISDSENERALVKYLVELSTIYGKNTWDKAEQLKFSDF